MQANNFNLDFFADFYHIKSVSHFDYQIDSKRSMELALLSDLYHLDSAIADGDFSEEDVSVMVAYDISISLKKLLNYYNSKSPSFELSYVSNVLFSMGMFNHCFIIAPAENINFFNLTNEIKGIKILPLESSILSNLDTLSHDYYDFENTRVLYHDLKYKDDLRAKSEIKF